MTEAKCQSCRFFVGKKAGGECRRLPPTMVLAPAKTVQGIDWVPSAAFPPVTSETWCGEFVHVAAMLEQTRAEGRG